MDEEAGPSNHKSLELLAGIRAGRQAQSCRGPPSRRVRWPHLHRCVVLLATLHITRHMFHVMLASSAFSPACSWHLRSFAELTCQHCLTIRHPSKLLALSTRAYWMRATTTAFASSCMSRQSVSTKLRDGVGICRRINPTQLRFLQHCPQYGRFGVDTCLSVHLSRSVKDSGRPLQGGSTRCKTAQNGSTRFKTAQRCVTLAVCKAC